MNLVIFVSTIFLFSFTSFLIGKKVTDTLNQKKTSNNDLEIAEYGIFGIIFFSFSALFLNFFVKLSPLVNTLFFIIFIVISLSKISKKNILCLLKFSLISTIISGITLAFDNINVPDAEVYHLPYVSIINHDKISLGISNIQHRYGFISIFQYLSAISNNYLFSQNGITISLCALFSNLIILFYFLIRRAKNTLIKYLSIIFFFFSLYEFNRFSEHGNDEVSFMLYFVCITYFFRSIFEKDNNFKKLLILTSYTVTLKTTLIFSILLPILVYFITKKKLKFLFNKSFFYCLLILIFWVCKNFLTTSCLIYPVEITCSKKVSWSNSKTMNPSNPIKVSQSSEAASKAWNDWQNIKPDYQGDVYSYLNDVNWTQVWFQHHFKIILKSLLMLNFFCILLIFLINEDFDGTIKKYIMLMLGFNLLFTCLWFYKFPIYRYGIGYIVTLNLLLYPLFYKKSFFIENTKIINSNQILHKLIIAILIVIVSKHTLRIYNNKNIKNLFPKITNEEIAKKRFVDGGYFLSKSRCFYTYMACTSETTNVHRIEKKFNYKIYIMKN
jgi:hypothetical protein